MRNVQARLWAPAVAVVAIAAVRLVCSWTSAAAHNWWTMAGDALLLAGIAVLSAYYVTIILRRTREAGIAADRVSRSRWSPGNLWLDHEAMIRDDLVRGQQELNERNVRLSGILDASRIWWRRGFPRSVGARQPTWPERCRRRRASHSGRIFGGAVTGDDETVVITAGARKGRLRYFSYPRPSYAPDRLQASPQRIQRCPSARPKSRIFWPSSLPLRV